MFSVKIKNVKTESADDAGFGIAHLPGFEAAHIVEEDDCSGIQPDLDTVGFARRVG